ncbi:6517_t:CDS:2 [Dentiscutata heterogama]|uniref:6517_t:CDS:1 n=1 Tax=Dentiscutata heterogama TaxID=1316150 RepID=A0ACA9KW33_9GLOM|nr:6517_t:CDS:2 [Dentiscutata heterogama]
MGGKLYGTNTFQQRKTHTNNTTTHTTSTPTNSLTTTIIPPELYIKICEYLTPDDLFSLSQVSKYFRNLLCSTSAATQAIWRNSRLRYLIYPRCPAPPDGMDERQYVIITNLAIRCHEYRLINHYKIPKDSLCGLTYTAPCNYKIYWKDDIRTAQENYMAALETNNIEEYIKKQTIKLNKQLEQIELQEWEFKNEMARWNYQNTLLFDEIKLRSSCIAEETAIEMGLDIEKLQDWGIYWYPIGNVCRTLTEDDWIDWRREVETECSRIKRKSQRWFHRFSIRSTIY